MDEYKQILIKKKEQLSKQNTSFAHARMRILIRLLRELEEESNP